MRLKLSVAKNRNDSHSAFCLFQMVTEIGNEFTLSFAKAEIAPFFRLSK